MTKAIYRSQREAIRQDRLADRQYARIVLIQRREDLERKISRVEAEIKALKEEKV